MSHIWQILCAVSIGLAALSANVLAASGDIDDWKVSYEDMSCIADGVALDPKNNYLWKVRLAHPVQNQLNLIVGLYNKEVASLMKGVPLTSVGVWLLIEGMEFKAQELMIDESGWLVLQIDNSNSLQRRITKNTAMSLVLKPNQKADKVLLSTLHLTHASSAFDWLHKCAVFGLRSVPRE